MSFRLPAFPGDDPCDLLPVLLEFDVKGLVAKNGVLFSNKYDPLPLPVLGLVLIPLAPTLELPYSFSHNLHLTQLALCSRFVTFSSSFASMDLPFSAFLPFGFCLPSLPGYLMYYLSLQGLRVEMKYGSQASMGMLIFCVITSG